MKKNSLRIAALLVGLTGSAAALAIPSYVYVGYWDVYSGPDWQTAPPTYTGQQAAALLFGGSYSDYAISTVDATVANINHMAWVDIYGVGFANPANNIVAENYAVDTSSAGYDQTGDTSAYVQDNGSTIISGITPPPLTSTTRFVSMTTRFPNRSRWPWWVSAFSGLGRFVA